MMNIRTLLPLLTSAPLMHLRYTQFLSGEADEKQASFDGKGDLTRDMLDHLSEDQLKRMEQLREEIQGKKS